jgi:hypothetical protein
MDLAQVFIFIFDLGWVFFVAWGMVLAAVSAIAFGRDLLPFTARRRPESTHLSSQATRGI